MVWHKNINAHASTIFDQIQQLFHKILSINITKKINRYINGQKKDTQCIPPLKSRNGNGVVDSELEQADEFNGQFTDVFNKNEHSKVPLPNRSAPFMNDIVVSAVGVTKLLKDLIPTKALGPDELHPRVLKELASELGPVFAHLFHFWYAF